jgi:3'(2'), 5'-bisphosphate nucleotidase
LESYDRNGDNNGSVNHDSEPFLSNTFLGKLLLWWRSKKILRSKQQTLALIKEHLRNLNSAIPIVLEDDSSAPFEERNRWNHFWLVGIENTTAVNSEIAEEFLPVINVALIQDRKPFLGVVYFPANDLMYCAAMNKGAFKIIRNGAPQELSSSKHPNSPIPDKTIDSKRTSSFAMRVCRSADEGNFFDDSFVNTKEWQTAAANALLKVMGYRLVDTETGRELEYNKDTWRNRSIYIARSIDDTSS